MNIIVSKYINFKDIPLDAQKYFAPEPNTLPEEGQSLPSSRILLISRSEIFLLKGLSGQILPAFFIC